MKNIEIERKYIIRIPSYEILKSFSDLTESKILQIYLSSPTGAVRRIRSRDYGEKTVYTETKKTRIDKMSVIEEEREIDRDTFLKFSLDKIEGTLPLEKTRYAFNYEGQIFEIDVYPQWKNTCILETELNSRDECVKFPHFIEIIEEVTGNKSYSNAAMSRCFPKEKEV